MSNLVNTISHELIEQSRGNLQGITLAPTHHLIIFWRSKVKGQGLTLVQVFGGIGIHVDAWASKFIF